jgi:hypothetical protein
MNTLLLDRGIWDVCKDANGNIAMASNPYAIAQDVASACRLFAGELWYDLKQGIPYNSQILGARPPIAFFKAQIEKAALSVPEVVKSRCMIASFSGRQLAGEIQVIDTAGTTHRVNF